MSFKYINHARNNVALANLAENRFIVLEAISLETNNGTLSFNKGEEINLGVDHSGNLVVKESVNSFIINDNSLAEALLENTVLKEELSCVDYKKMKFDEAVKAGMEVKDIIKSVIDNSEIDSAEKAAKERKSKYKSVLGEKYTRIECNKGKIGDECEVPVIHRKKKLPLADKAKKIRECESFNGIKVNAIEIFESEMPDSLMLNCVKLHEDPLDRYEVGSVEDFNSKATESGCTVELDSNSPNILWVKCSDGKVCGKFDKGLNHGIIFSQKCFDSEQELDQYIVDEPTTLGTIIPEFNFEIDLDDEDLANVNNAIGNFENSNHNTDDVEKLNTNLVNNNVSKEESASICNSY